MGFKSMLRSWLFDGSDPAAGEEAVREAKGVTIDVDEDGWRRLSGDVTRDINPLTQQRQQDLAVYLWKTNPLAKQMVELPLAFLLAEGVRLTVPDEEAQGWLDDFWSDPINNMDIKLVKKARELALFGEQCWPVFVNELDGHVRLGYIDPGQIANVVLDPENAEQPIGIITKTRTGRPQKRYRVIVNGDETCFSPEARRAREQFTDGACFYFTVNDLTNQARGASDLLAQMDWLDGYDQALWGELERWDSMRAFLWDITLKGATPEEVEKRAKTIAVPRSGGVRVHNDAEQWDAVTPDLKSVDGSSFARLFRNHLMGGAALPEHWYGGGGDVNRATAAEMDAPTLKTFTMRQTMLKYILVQLGSFVIRSRLKALYGSAPDQAADPAVYRCRAEFPEMASEDISRYATALAQVVAAVASAIREQLVTRRTGVGIIALVAARLGLDIDADAELDAVREDADRQAEDDLLPPPDAEDGDPGDGETA